MPFVAPLAIVCLHVVDSVCLRSPAQRRRRAALGVNSTHAFIRICITAPLRDDGGTEQKTEMRMESLCSPSWFFFFFFETKRWKRG